MIIATVLCEPQKGFAQAICPPQKPVAAPFPGFTCQLETMNNDCKEWFKANPQTLPYARNCSSNQDHRSDIEKISVTCKQAFGRAWGDTWGEMLSSLKKSKDFYNACEADVTLACKKRLAKEAYFNYTNDNQLRSVDTLDLLRKRDQILAQASRDPAFHQKMQKAGVPLPQYSGLVDLPWPAVMAVANAKLQSMNVKYQCYNDAGYAKMLCYAAGIVIDPTLVVGGVAVAGLKGARYASLILSETSKVAEAVDVAAQTKKLYEIPDNGLRAIDHARDYVPSRQARAQAAGFTNMNTDRFTVVAAQNGEHGGQRFVVQRQRGWFDSRSDLGADGADVTTNLMAYPMALGPDEASFFGIKQLDGKHIMLPDVKEVRGAIDEFNDRLPAGDPRRIQLKPYQTDSTFVSSTDYLQRFVDKGEIPAATNGRQAYHDISSHELQGAFLDNHLTTAMQQRVKLWMDFRKQELKDVVGNPEKAKSFLAIDNKMQQYLTNQVDKLGMGIGDVVPQKEERYLVSLNASHGVAREDTGFAGLTHGLSSEQMPILADRNVQDFYNHSLHADPALQAKFKQFLQNTIAHHPEAAGPLPYDFPQEVQKLAKAQEIKDPAAREKALRELPLTQAFYERRDYLTTLVNSPY